MKTKTLFFSILLTTFYGINCRAQNYIGTTPEKPIYNFQAQFFHTNSTQNTIIIGIVFLGLLIIILDYYLKKNFPLSLKNFIYWNSFINQEKQNNPNVITKNLIYAFLGLLISSLTFYLGLTKILSITIWGIILVFTIQTFFNFITSLFINNILNNKEIASVILNINLSYWKELPELAYIFLILIAISKSNLALIFSIIWAFIWLFFYVTKILHLLKTFSDAKFHLFYFILYLCAVEFMPFLLLFTVFKS